MLSLALYVLLAVCVRSERYCPAGFEQQPADGTEFGGLVGLHELPSRGRLHGATRATYW